MDSEYITMKKTKKEIKDKAEELKEQERIAFQEKLAEAANIVGYCSEHPEDVY